MYITDRVSYYLDELQHFWSDIFSENRKFACFSRGMCRRKLYVNLNKLSLNIFWSVLQSEEAKLKSPLYLFWVYSQYLEYHSLIP